MLPNISALWFIACPDPVAELRSGVYIDPAATTEFMERAFANSDVTPIGTADLASAVDSAENRVFAAHFGRLAVLAGVSLRTANPAELTSYLTDLGVGDSWVLISLDLASDTGCFARWNGGELQRSFAGTSTRICDDLGLPYPFEGPFWAGEHPQPNADDPLALPFHPGALADAAQKSWFGFAFGADDSDGVDPTRIPVTVYRVGPDDGLDNYVETSVSLRETETQPVPKVVVPTAEESPAEQTAPIEKVADEAPAAAPGPISRYFGFRGRI